MSRHQWVVVVYHRMGRLLWTLYHSFEQRTQQQYRSRQDHTTTTTMHVGYSCNIDAFQLLILLVSIASLSLVYGLIWGTFDFFWTHVMVVGYRYLISMHAPFIKYCRIGLQGTSFFFFISHDYVFSTGTRNGDA